MSPEQCRKARELLDITPYELGRRAGVPPADILMFENQQLARATSVSAKLTVAFLGFGVTFTTTGVAAPRPKAWRGT